MKIDLTLLKSLVEIGKESSKIIMNIYDSNFTYNFKSDNSPVTQADIASNDFLNNTLKQNFNIPILSEEGIKEFNFKDIDKPFWCIDPLDGTKEFIKKNGEFTVNIALIINKVPVLGIVAAPAKNIIYAGAKGLGAFKSIQNKDLLPIYTKNIDYNNLTFTVSRSHIDCETESIIKKYNARKMLSGSALKIMYVAEGLADAYPRLSPTMIWDTAAGQIILEEAGGSLFSAKTKEPMIYNITNLTNDYFIAANDFNLNHFN